MKKKSRAFTDLGLLSTDSCWRGALCKANGENHQSKVIFKSRKLLHEKNLSGATTCSWQSNKYLPLPFNISSACMSQIHQRGKRLSWWRILYTHYCIFDKSLWFARLCWKHLPLFDDIIPGAQPYLVCVPRGSNLCPMQANTHGHSDFTGAAKKYTS